MSGIKRDQADVWFSKAVRIRDNHTCQRCNKGPNVECAHIFGRANKSTRWDMDNAISLCHWCHKYFTANPVEFYDFLESAWGTMALQLLREKKQHILKTNKELRAEVSKHYREQVRAAEANPEHVIENWI